jgi:hypothetical protein
MVKFGLRERLDMSIVITEEDYSTDDDIKRLEKTLQGLRIMDMNLYLITRYKQKQEFFEFVKANMKFLSFNDDIQYKGIHRFNHYHQDLLMCSKVMRKFEIDDILQMEKLLKYIIEEKKKILDEEEYNCNNSRIILEDLENRLEIIVNEREEDIF